MAHAGEALESRRAFESLSKLEQDSVIEFLKSLQALPPGTTALIVDEHFRPRSCHGHRVNECNLRLFRTDRTTTARGVAPITASLGEHRATAIASLHRH